MRNILFIARDPGGANSLLGLIEICEKLYNCRVLAKDFAAEIFTKTNIDFTKVEDLEEVKSFLDQSDFIITGTSYKDELEQSIWNYAKENSLNLCAYMDHWMGYERFYNEQKSQYIFPSKLLFVDPLAEKTFKKKFSNSTIETFVVGSIPLSKILENKLSIDDKKLYLNKYFPSKNTPLYTFAAEKIKGFDVEKKYGFNEFDQFEKLFNLLDSLNYECELFFLPHPKHKIQELSKELQNISDKSKNSKIDVKINIDIPKDIMIQLSDKVFGMNSMVLVESMLVEKDVCSIQLDIQTRSDFTLLLEDYIYCADTQEKLLSFLKDEYTKKQYEISYIQNSKDNFLNLIKENI